MNADSEPAAGPATARAGDRRRPVDAVPAGPGVPDPAAMFLDHYLMLVRVAQWLVDDRECAEEIVQDVFAAMHSRWRAFPGPDAALRYLRTAVVNRSRSLLRRRRIIRRFTPDAAVAGAAAEADALAGMERAAVRAAVRGLPRRQREVIVLRYFQGLSVREASRVLGISESAVKSSASRALDSIQAALERSS